jgi:hypothetical protein
MGGISSKQQASEPMQPRDNMSGNKPMFVDSGNDMMPSNTAFASKSNMPAVPDNAEIVIYVTVMYYNDEIDIVKNGESNERKYIFSSLKKDLNDTVQNDISCVTQTMEAGTSLCDFMYDCRSGRIKQILSVRIVIGTDPSSQYEFDKEFFDSILETIKATIYQYKHSRGKVYISEIEKVESVGYTSETDIYIKIQLESAFLNGNKM